MKSKKNKQTSFDSEKIKVKYAKNITPRCRNITKLEDEWIKLCDKNGRDCWIRWIKVSPRKEKPIFCSCDVLGACDRQEFETIEDAIAWEGGYR